MRKPKPVTFGQLTGLLSDLGYERRVVDEHRLLYIDPKSDSMFFLPNQPPGSEARESDVSHVRTQFYWRGIMEHDDFDAHFANLAAAKS